MRWYSTRASLIILGSVAVLGAAPPDTDLLTAVKAGNQAAVRAFVQKRVGVTAKEADGTTALHWAVRAEDEPTTRLLIAAGADVNAVNRYGATPLSLAARAGNATLIGALLKAGAHVKVADQVMVDGRTLLMLAARAGNVEVVSALAAHGADVAARERRTGTTALMWAALDDRPAVVRALSKLGADLDARSAITAYPHTPPGVIGDKLEEGYSYVGQTVLPRGGWTALMYAARQGSTGAAQALAESGADVNVSDPDGSTALTFAIINGHYELAALLVDKGANPNIGDRAGMTPLYAAVDMHTLPSTFGRPDLRLPVVAGSVGAIRMLLANGADPNARLKSKILKRVYNPGDAKLDEGATAFMRAAKGGDAAVMRLLLQAGADPTLAQKNGNTPLMLAAAAGPRGGSDSNNPDRATDDEAMAAVKLCVELGIDVNAANAVGDTAVHAALNSPAVIRFLAAHGAKLDIKNKQGRTPLDAAMRNREGHVTAIALLRGLIPGDGSTTPLAKEKSE